MDLRDAISELDIFMEFDRSQPGYYAMKDNETL